ncbi:adenylate/guanylate cyclase domain-containing protein [Maribacter sp. MAR_2009_72]|uniref:adenylate/guanylate cyclase domain-containing protein n=1 Tax=Maribacter sp. MAR_2009_72 TaxID=1250050 RepID=UPI00119C8DD8|nr:adenylate/guanylate cyclase domain-containing protein [Maribacter sp. MAR_2009_72]TVZ16640.1 adenylate cyclase [Maribacter sp. MAR_2009_72]
MPIAPKTKRNIHRIIPFAIIWLILGWINLFTQEAVTLNTNLNPSSAISITTEVFLFANFALIVVSLLVGAIEVLWLDKLFNKKNFSKKIIYKLVFYTLFLLLVILITFPIAAAIESETSLFSAVIWTKFVNFISSIEFASTMVSISFSLFVSLLYFEISENIGHGVLMNFFTGKYHRPIEEKRIFMFTDMKSSTTIAEQMGHIQYFELLKAYYNDFSDAIVRFSGEIYQYIGDEIVISWKYDNEEQLTNAISCFFAMKKDLLKKTKWYQSNFGIVPTFKAGLHAGTVTTGEIGALRKEIIFTGDVLNTTSRIQGLCNELNVDLLVSQEIVTPTLSKNKYVIEPMGTVVLKGKEESKPLFTIKQLEYERVQ